MLVGVLVDDPEKVQIFGFIVVFPLTFASNAFVPTGQCPAGCRPGSKVNPVTILADAVRGLLVGSPVGNPVVQSLLWAVAITAGLRAARGGHASSAGSADRRGADHACVER